MAIASYGLIGCAPGSQDTPLRGTTEEVELASLMGELQRHSTKLGLSIRSRNQPLAAFYLHELEEVLEELGSINLHDGMPIGKPSEVIMAPLQESLETQLLAKSLETPGDTAAWPAVAAEYEALIDGCNRCHSATAHAFIRIVPEPGESGFNQQFVP